jgi:hypothetical protein
MIYKDIESIALEAFNLAGLKASLLKKWNFHEYLDGLNLSDYIAVIRDQKEESVSHRVRFRNLPYMEELSSTAKIRDILDENGKSIKNREIGR